MLINKTHKKVYAIDIRYLWKICFHFLCRKNSSQIRTRKRQRLGGALSLLQHQIRLWLIQLWFHFLKNISYPFDQNLSISALIIFNESNSTAPWNKVLQRFTTDRKFPHPFYAENAPPCFRFPSGENILLAITLWRTWKILRMFCSNKYFLCIYLFKCKHRLYVTCY